MRRKKSTAPEVKHLDKIINTDVSAFCARAWVYLLDKGWCDRDAPYSWDKPAFFIEEAGAVVAAMAYSYNTTNHNLFINLAYVHPEHRRKGLYRLLYEAVLAKAKELGAYEVSSCVDVENKDMQAVAVALGRTATYIGYSVRLDR